MNCGITASERFGEFTWLALCRRKPKALVKELKVSWQQGQVKDAGKQGSLRIIYVGLHRSNTGVKFYLCPEFEVGLGSKVSCPLSHWQTIAPLGSSTSVVTQFCRNFPSRVTFHISESWKMPKQVGCQWKHNRSSSWRCSIYGKVKFLFPTPSRLKFTR